jgi:hypothetical protein
LQICHFRFLGYTANVNRFSEAIVMGDAIAALKDFKRQERDVFQRLQIAATLGEAQQLLKELEGLVEKRFVASEAVSFCCESSPEVRSTAIGLLGPVNQAN